MGICRSGGRLSFRRCEPGQVRGFGVSHLSLWLFRERTPQTPRSACIVCTKSDVTKRHAVLSSCPAEWDGRGAALSAEIPVRPSPAIIGALHKDEGMSTIDTEQPAMHIRLNDQPLVVAGQCSLAELLVQQGIAPDTHATAVNGQFVPRTLRAGTALQSGDVVTCFQAIVGG